MVVAEGSEVAKKGGSREPGGKEREEGRVVLIESIRSCLLSVYVYPEGKAHGGRSGGNVRLAFPPQRRICPSSAAPLPERGSLYL